MVACAGRGDPLDMSVLVWSLMGIGLWHFTVYLPDRFWGGIAGAFLFALCGALISGYLLPSPGIPPHNPPGLVQALWPIPGAVLAMALAYLYGARREA
jgi:hypothetical protein